MNATTTDGPDCNGTHGREILASARQRTRRETNWQETTNKHKWNYVEPSLTCWCNARPYLFCFFGFVDGFDLFGYPLRVMKK